MSTYCICSSYADLFCTNNIEPSAWGMDILHIQKTVYTELLVLVNCLFILAVQSLSHDRLFATPWTAARQASLSITNSQSLLKLMSIELVMPSNQLMCIYSYFRFFSIMVYYKIYFKIIFKKLFLNLCGGFGSLLQHVGSSFCCVALLLWHMDSLVVECGPRVRGLSGCGL